MYIPDFWVGVIATILVEIAITSVLVIISTMGKDKDENINNKSHK